MMRDHPEKIRSVILDSTVVIPGNKGPSNWAPNAQRSFDLMFETCAASSACASSYPDLENVLVQVVNQLNDTAHCSPVSQADGTIVDTYITGDRFIGGVQSAMYQANLIPLLPTVIYETAAGNMGLLDSFVPQLLSTGGSDQGLYASTICAEQVPFTSIEEADAARQGLNSTLTDPIYESTSRLIFDMCNIWQVTPRPDIENEPVVSDIATLVLAGQYDPATPPSDGEEAAESLSNSQYFVFNGLSHGVLRSDSAAPGELSCAARIVMQFLDDPAVAVDGSCASGLPGAFD